MNCGKSEASRAGPMSKAQQVVDGQVAGSRKLQILCLHGFRQSASQFRGRTAALQKKLRHLADFVFVDGPHEVPLIYQPREREEHGIGPKDRTGGLSRGASPESSFQLPAVGRPRYAWLVNSDADTWQQQEQQQQQESSIDRALESGKGGAEVSRKYQETEGSPSDQGPRGHGKVVNGCVEQPVDDHGPLSEPWKIRSDIPVQFNIRGGDDVDSKAKGCDLREVQLGHPFLQLQHTTQRGGWGKSKTFLLDVLANQGPFDGLMGFSQGASIVSILSALAFQERYVLGENVDGIDYSMLSRTNTSGVNRPISFSFVILCSGFPFKGYEPEIGEANMQRLKGFVKCPSLHIFGGTSTQDRQIALEESEELAAWYDEETRVIVRHDCGHIIPTKTPFLSAYKDFLQKFI